MDWSQFWENVIAFLTSFGMDVIGALFVLVVGLRVIKWLFKWMSTNEKFDRFDQNVRWFMVSFMRIALYIVLFITVAMILGIPTTSFITALASCGVAIGLALQGALSNFAGGLMILIFKPFKLGDYIETPDAAGKVAAITVVYTVLHTLDNKVITVPNGTLTNCVVTNFSAVENRRVDIDFTVSYDSDVAQVKSILMQIIRSHELILSDPEPFARLSRHGDSALVFTVRVWCRTEDYWDVNFDLMEQVKAVFDDHGISIPYPQMDVHVDSAN